MSIDEYRKLIDETDAEIVKLFAERMETAKKIGEYKKANGLPVYDARREREKLKEVSSGSPEEIRGYTNLLYSLMFELSRAYQYRTSGASGKLADDVLAALESSPRMLPEFAFVACQGVEGANSQFACEKLFKNPNIMFFSGFDAVFTAIEKGLCRYGVLPVENSTAGTVNTVYDLMMKHDFRIVRSVEMRITHSLLAKKEIPLESVKEVYSHEQALLQCSEFLKTMPGAKLIPCENTAEAAKKVSESDRDDICALSHPSCASYYGLRCLKNSAENSPDNFTRFICISRELEILPGADRTSLMVTLPNKPGALYMLLSKFFALGINLIKLESRPIPDREFEFMFYFDLDIPVYAPEFRQLLCELPSACESCSYLGSYSEAR